MLATDVINIFDRLFCERYATQLVGGAGEPFYEVCPDDVWEARIYFREDFISSALHEVAHWCVAGAARRKRNDYGYWYDSERDAQAQKRFEAVEVKPQALEWIFSLALKQPFKVSADNLDLENYDNARFKQQVQRQALRYAQQGLSPRAELFAQGLYQFSHTSPNAEVAEPSLLNTSWQAILCSTNFEEPPN